MQFPQMETQDGVRLTWNVLPSTKPDAANLCHVPIAALYSPLAPLTELAVTPYRPVHCSNANCEAILNPYCNVEAQTGSWTCVLCLKKNPLPQHYAANIHLHSPPELLPQYTTIEYLLEQPTPVAQVPGHLGELSADNSTPLAFVFVVDICIIPEELDALKSALVQTLALIPENAYVGLITFDQSVSLHDLVSNHPSRRFTFNGDKECDSSKLSNAIGLTLVQNTSNSGTGFPQHPTNPAVPGATTMGGMQDDVSRHKHVMPVSPFLQQVGTCEQHVISLLDNLKPSPWVYDQTARRPVRATGAALSVAISLLEATGLRNINGRIISFVGGVCTSEAGKVVNADLIESMRSHQDIAKKDKTSAPFYTSACAFYERLALRARKVDAVIDLFACSLDQVGLAEMRCLVEQTGGNVVLDDSFTRGVFQGSLRRLFLSDPDDNNALVMSFGAQMTVRCSPHLRVVGSIGHLTSMEVTSPCVGPTSPATGIGGTSTWRLGGLDHNSTVCVFFVLHSPTPVTGGNHQSYIQFATRYRHSTGRVHLRVTTLAKQHINASTPEGLQYIRAGFDQEAAVVVLARQAIYQTYINRTPPATLIRQLDSTLVKTVSKFSAYTKGDPDSLRMTQEVAFLPQFVFYLRRSQFFQIFNSSPDETAFYHCVALKENTTNTLVMIQPTLTAYSLDGPACPVLLDMSAINSSRILLLDTYFHLVIWYGDTIVKWRQEQLHLQSEYAYFAQLLQAPVTDAKALMERRFPTPRFIECVERGSQARFLMAKLNPGSTTSEGSIADTTSGSQSQAMFSEDMNLKTFLHHLKKLATTS